MKKSMMLCLIGTLLLSACQTPPAELSNEEKEAMVQAVKETGNEFLSDAFGDPETSDVAKVMAYYAEDMDNQWQGKTVGFAYQTGVLAEKRADLEKLMVQILNTRISTTIDVKDTYYSVLSEDMVLEFSIWEASMVMKDSTEYGPFPTSNSVIWKLKDGEWKIQYWHQVAQD